MNTSSKMTKNKILTSIKREYWEYKGTMLWLPVGLMVTFLILFAIASFIGPFAKNITIDINSHTTTYSTSTSTSLSTNDNHNVQLDSSYKPIEEEEEIHIDFSTGKSTTVTQQDKLNLQPQDYKIKENTRKMVKAISLINFAFIILSWTAAMYYLLNSLYNDRRDNSVLFWKSLPVSETQNVLTKLLIATLVFPLIATVAAWITQIGYLIAAAVILNNFDSQPWALISPHLDIIDITFGSVAMIFSAALFALPIFTWLLLASAFTKRSPFLTAVLPPAIIILLESWLWNSEIIFQWIIRHIPFNITSISNLHSMIVNPTNLLSTITLFDLISGIIVATAFTAAAIACRNYKFEIQ